MPGFLRQSTASQARAIGPFVSDTDFKTVQTGLTIANTDIKLIVNGGASANKNSGGGTHRANGVYGLTFDATDTATVGEIEVSVVVAGALPVFDKFIVVEEAVYDALFVASAPGYVVDQPVNVTKWLGTAVSTPTVAGVPNVNAKTWNDLATVELPLVPTTAGRKLDVSAGGEAGLDWANIGSPTTVVGLSGTTVKTATDVETDTQDIQGRIPAALTGGGKIKASTDEWNATAVATPTTAGVPRVDVKAMEANVLTATAIAADAITAAKIADGAIDAATFAAGAIDAAAIAADAIGASELAAGAASEIASAVRTELTTELGRVDAAVSTRAPESGGNVAAIKAKTDSLTFTTAAKVDARTFTNDDKTGYGLSAAAVQAIWDALTSALTTSGSIGKWILDKLDVVLSTRLASSSYTAPPTAAAVADAVWEEALTDHSGTAGSTAEALGAAGSAGDPWATALPGGYSSGQAGKIVGDNLNATVGSRATPAQVNTEADTALADVGLTPTITGRIDAAVSTRASQTSVDDLPTNAELATALASADDATLAAIGALSIPTAAQNRAEMDSNSTKLASIDGKTTNLPSDPADESLIIAATDAVMSRLGAPAGASVSADVAGVKSDSAAIKLKTDSLPASPAAVGSAMTLTSGERDAIAAAMLDLSNAIETGLTTRGALRLALAALAGKASGLDTTTATFRNAVADSKNRIVATVDADGNRSVVTVDAS